MKKKWCWADNTYHEREHLQSPVNETNINSDFSSELIFSMSQKKKKKEYCIPIVQVIEANKNHTCSQIVYLKTEVSKN